MGKKHLRVALLFNLKHSVSVTADAPPDALAEFDSEETVAALAEALRAGGHQVIPLEADTSLPETIRRAQVDICFNIAEGLGGDSREAQVPALLEMLGIPYTGSKVLAHAISLDKAITKRICRDAGLPTAPFQTFHRGDEPLDPALDFPLFVKPVREGSGMGIGAKSVVRDEAALREQVNWIIRSYRQPALVETFLTGREFTVGFLGNPFLPPGTLPRAIYGEHGLHLFPVLEIDSHVTGEGLYNATAKSFYPGEDGAPLYLCPADIPAELADELGRLTIKSLLAIGAIDVGRVDFRLGPDGRPYLLEINTLPGLNPTLSDICIAANAEGFPYVTLVNEILDLARRRYNLLP